MPNTISKINGYSLKDNVSAKTWYGSITTNASTASKVASINNNSVGNYSLINGSIISLSTNYGNSVEGLLTLNINSTGAKNIYLNGVATSSSNPLTWEAGEVLTFIYSSSPDTCYELIARSNASGGGVVLRKWYEEEVEVN